MIIFLLTVIFNENYHAYQNLEQEAKFWSKQFFKIVTGMLFNLNIYELRKVLIKINVYYIDYDALMYTLLYNQEGMVLLDRIKDAKKHIEFPN
jgi:hypothetical protein